MNPLSRTLTRADGIGYVVLVGSGLLLAASRALPPSPTGIGTHQALGLPPCPIYALTGWPCPACGMTTAWALAARGRLLDAFTTQPFGALLALLAAVGFVAAPMLFARRVPVAEVARRVLGWRAALVALALVLGAWGYKAVMLADG